MSSENTHFPFDVADDLHEDDVHLEKIERSAPSLSKGSSNKFSKNFASLPHQLNSQKLTSDATFKSRAQELKRKETMDPGKFQKSEDSLRKSCSFIEDDLSDNDLIEVQNTPDKFKTRLPSSRQCLEDIKLCIKQRSSEEIPLYISEHSSDEKDNLQSDDALIALQELDSVLDVYDASRTGFDSSLCHTECESENTNIEDCLLDLDDYLEKIEKSISEDCSNQKLHPSFTPNVLNNCQASLQRGHKLRTTWGCVSERRPTDYSKNAHSSIPIYGTLGRGYRNSICEDDCKMENNHKNDMHFTETGVKEAQDFEKGENSTTNISMHRKRSFSAESFEVNHANGNQALTEEQIFQNIIEQNSRHNQNDDPRPRQYGRRAERYSGDPVPNNEGGLWTQSCNIRPMSAPAFVPLSLLEHPSSIQTCIVSDGSTMRSSRNTSPVTIASTTDSSELSGISQTVAEPTVVIAEECPQQGASEPADNGLEIETSQKLDFNTYWPNSYGRTLALASCTLGLFNICRFAVLSINYGVNFLIQFTLLSLILGIPFLWLQMCLGAKIKSGPVSMWRISPICRGIGISLVFVQYFLATYSSVVIVWLLVYLSDTIMFQSSYRWSEMTHSLVFRNISQANCTITQSVPDYFNVKVLQRLQFDSKGVRAQISDRLAFYLVILWAAVFVFLCKGLKSFGKVVLILGVLPLFSMVIITAKLLYIVDVKRMQNIFSAPELEDFLINSKTWTAAAQETFLTWGLLGASAIAISSRKCKQHSKLSLRRDAIVVVIITIFGLCLSALMGLCCIEILNRAGFVYVPGSYEKPRYYSSVFSPKSFTNTDIISFPSKYVPHYSSLIGEVYRRQEDVHYVSGYQVLRFVTELFPAVAAVSKENLSFIWVALVFVMLFAFGVAQLCVMWKPLSSALGNSTSAVLLSCVTGLLLSIPFATEVGITLLHYLDMLIGGAWFIPLLWAAEIFGIFLIRGRPYNGDDLVNDLNMSGSMSAFLALSWNVLLPISLIALAIIDYKVSLSHQMYYWRGRSYYAYWARKLGALIQIGFLLLVPITAIIQIYRYLTTGPPDILDRIQLLYRPMEEFINSRPAGRMNRNGYDARRRQSTNVPYVEPPIQNMQDDAPPKYTPPPSYTTATGARIAKIIRQSIRRSVRRFLGSSERSRQMEQDGDVSTFPPNYASVLQNVTAASHENTLSISESIDLTNRSNRLTLYSRSHSLGRKHVFKKRRPFSGSREINRGSNAANRCSPRDRPYTAADVITTLRSSTRCRSESQELPHSRIQTFRSIENLVLNAEPPGLSSTVASENITENDRNNSSVI